MLGKELQVEALVLWNWLGLYNGLSVATVAYLYKVPSLFLGSDFIPPPNRFLIHMHRGYKTQMIPIGAIVKSYGWQRIIICSRKNAPTNHKMMCSLCLMSCRKNAPTFKKWCAVFVLSHRWSWFVHRETHSPYLQAWIHHLRNAAPA